MTEDNAMALAYKADADKYQAEAIKLRSALVALLPWVEKQGDIYCFTPGKYAEYRNAKEAVK